MTRVDPALWLARAVLVVAGLGLWFWPELTATSQLAPPG
jgi:hypothetical protein